MCTGHRENINEEYPLNPTIESVTERIRTRSRDKRLAYLARIDQQAQAGPARGSLSCSNLAHGMAACGQGEKGRLTDELVANIAIVSAYNDMLSAHQPYESYPEKIRQMARQLGAVAQVAGGVPAMCDGVTQGQDGMELSLFSRDVIALSTAVALSHNMFDAAMYLGVCDKIVPGLLMGALSFGHLPAIFVPAGPMPSGLPNSEKAKVREAYASGDASKQELIAAESAAYHSPGTCTFYGTANSNQMLMEFMGLQLPGSSFVNPDDPLREVFTAQAVRQVLALTYESKTYLPVGRIIDEQSIVNGMVGLMATGGSTNHTIHLISIAAAAGITIDWQDMADLSAVVPQLAQVYPNGQADVNQFHAAGGLACVIAELLEGGLLHAEVNTVAGAGLARYTWQPEQQDEQITWQPVRPTSADRSILRSVDNPFQSEGGIRLVDGNIGRAVVKVSAVASAHQQITAPAKVFASQDEFAAAYEAGELKEDMVAVLRGQGPRANGMPELHRLSPFLGVMQNNGLKVALLTDGRMSGASGKILGAIQVTPEAAAGGGIGRIRDGDMITIDAVNGTLQADANLAEREDFVSPNGDDVTGMGRELFQVFRQQASSAESGGSIFNS
jgi:phosphogluconate dehydratase